MSDTNLNKDQKTEAKNEKVELDIKSPKASLVTEIVGNDRSKTLNLKNK